jgi:5-methylcytosine-specific restriction endonuclease McrA
LNGQNSHRWLPIKSLHPSNRRSVRVRIHIRDRKCRECGTEQLLHVHHIDGNPRNNDESNLILLCEEHHAQAHEHRGEYKTARLIRAQHLARRPSPQLSLFPDFRS